MNLFTATNDNHMVTVTCGDSQYNADNYCVMLTVDGKDVGATEFTRDYFLALQWAQNLLGVDSLQGLVQSFTSGPDPVETPDPDQNRNNSGTTPVQTTATPEKVWTRDEIAEKLETRDAWVVKGLLAIYGRQTEDEQATQTTNHHNSVGFSGVDAEILSSFAEQVRRGRTLSPKQMALARRKMVKYAGQLAKIANGLI